MASNNFDIKNFIKTARMQGVPDRETFNYLQSRGLINSNDVIPQNDITSIGKAFEGSGNNPAITTGFQKIATNPNVPDFLKQGASKISGYLANPKPLVPLRDAPPVIGSMIGLGVGGPIGSGIGGAVGETVSQGIENLTGVRKGFSLGKIAATGAIDFAIPKAFELGSKFLESLKDPAENFVEKAIGPTAPREIAKELETQLEGGDTIGRQYLDQGTGVHTLKGLSKLAKSSLNEAGDAINTALEGEVGNTPISMEGIPEAFDDSIARAQNVMGKDAANKLIDLKNIYVAKGDTLTASEANELKQDIYKVLKDRAYDVTNPNLSDIKISLKKVAYELSQRISDAIPDIVDANASYGFWKEVNDNVVMRMAKEFNKAGFLQNLLNLNFGSAVKSASGSTPFKLAAGEGLNYLSQLPKSIPENITQASKIGLIELANRMLKNQ